ncbi:Holliday junction resolvase RuvX [Dielma fastidiosa]|uniref:Putative pre-16S rRNA nuclease n=1 Tax=Dielma fastidiosa TaxID=1034346 RepID=A0AB35UJ65_9FIRM|nr:Holliday junction resolvase RuvX [Dielma fastidiosa]MDY5168067.1 Holliday junction resolvase RuvX [Dielma fastidiosa]
MKRILGLDLGSRTCGVSVSDVMGMIARPVETLRFQDDDYDQCLVLLQKYINEFQIETVVLGLPKHMNGDIGIRGEVSIAFKEKLEAQGLKVVLWDERLTTVAAERILIAADVSRKKRKQVIDQMASVQILQGYLDSKS